MSFRTLVKIMSSCIDSRIKTRKVIGMVGLMDSIKMAFWRMEISFHSFLNLQSLGSQHFDMSHMEYERSIGLMSEKFRKGRVNIFIILHTKE
jgi:hypothetical protein